MSQAIRTRRASSKPAGASGTSFQTVCSSTAGTRDASWVSHARAVVATHGFWLAAYAASMDSQVRDSQGATPRRFTGSPARWSPSVDQGLNRREVQYLVTRQALSRSHGPCQVTTREQGHGKVTC